MRERSARGVEFEEKQKRKSKKNVEKARIWDCIHAMMITAMCNDDDSTQKKKQQRLLPVSVLILTTYGDRTIHFIIIIIIVSMSFHGT